METITKYFKTSKYYYTLLNKKQKGIYEALEYGIGQYATQIEVPLISAGDLSLIFFDALLRDCPLFYYVEAFTNIDFANKNITLVAPIYKHPKTFIDSKTNVILRCMQRLDHVKSATDMDKVKFVHEFCMNNFEYDYTAYENIIQSISLKDTPEDYAYSILGPILRKKGVCAGLSKFFKLSLDYLNIKSLVVIGEAKSPRNDGTMDSHAWNIVKISGKTYQFDVTWNICHKGHIYFNLSDDEMKKDHVMPSNVPACTTVGDDYFAMNSLVAGKPTELDVIIERNLREGRKKFMVKIQNVKKPQKLTKKVLDTAHNCYEKVFGQRTTVWYSHHVDTSVFFISFGDV